MRKQSAEIIDSVVYNANPEELLYILRKTSWALGVAKTAGRMLWKHLNMKGVKTLGRWGGKMLGTGRGKAIANTALSGAGRGALYGAGAGAVGGMMSKDAYGNRRGISGVFPGAIKGAAAGMVTGGLAGGVIGNRIGRVAKAGNVTGWTQAAQPLTAAAGVTGGFMMRGNDAPQRPGWAKTVNRYTGLRF